MRYVSAAYSRVPPSSSAAFGIGTAESTTIAAASIAISMLTFLLIIFPSPQIHHPELELLPKEYTIQHSEIQV